MARLCLWLDTSRQTAAQTADEVLSRAGAEAAVPGTQIQSGQAGSTADMGARK